MDFEKGCFYKFIEKNGDSWLIQCLDVNTVTVDIGRFGRPKRRKILKFMLQSDPEIAEVTDQELKNLIGNGIQVELLDNKLDIAKALLNGF